MCYCHQANFFFWSSHYDRHSDNELVKYTGANFL